MHTFIVIIALGLLVVIHEFGHFFAARIFGMKVIKYSVGFFHPILKWTSKKTDIIYQIGIIPLGGFVQIKGMNPFEDGAFDDNDSYQTKPAWQRAIVIVAGPLSNLVLAWMLLTILFIIGNPVPVHESIVGQVIPDAPAQAAGIQIDDHVLKFNNKEISTWSQLASNLHDNPNKEVNLLIKRDNNNIEIKVTPADKNGIGLIGIGPSQKIVSLPIHKASNAAFLKCFSVLGDNIKGIAHLVTGKSQNVEVAGPVKIVEMATNALQQSFVNFLAFVVYISLMLFLFNLLPIPALDGGRTVFLLYEVISRRRVSKKVDFVLNTVFFMLLIGIMGIVVIKELFFG